MARGEVQERNASADSSKIRLGRAKAFDCGAYGCRAARDVVMRRRVLVVEDEILVAMVLEETLTDAGFEVSGIASSERQAIEMAEARPPDLAVVDVNLAPGDGRNVARALVERHGTLILFATAFLDQVRREVFSGGVQACLPKPYQPNDVPVALDALSAISEGRRPQRVPPNLVHLGEAS